MGDERVLEPRPRGRARWSHDEDDAAVEPARRPAGPAKLTRSAGHVVAAGVAKAGKLTRTADAGAPTAEQALGYAQHLLAEERGWSRVQRRATPDGAEPEAGSLATAFGFLAESRGAQRLPAELALQLSESLGLDASRVRVHIDDQAAAAAAQLRARAFTIEEDIYFAAGAYDPHSEAGLELLAHEVAHVAQHQRGALAGARGVSRPEDAHEHQADELARRFLAQRARRAEAAARGQAQPASEGAARRADARVQDQATSVRPSSLRRGDPRLAATELDGRTRAMAAPSIADMATGDDPWWGASPDRAPAARGATAAAAEAREAARSPDAAPAAAAPEQAAAHRKPAATSSSGAASAGGKATGAAAPLPTVVDLLGKADFEPTPEVAAHIEQAGKAGAQVRVKLGSLSPVSILRVKKVRGRYVTVEDSPQVVPLSHPLLVPASGLSPVVRVHIGASRGSAITGHVALGDAPGSASSIARALAKDPSAIGLRGFSLPHLALHNQLEGGALTFGTQKTTRFELGGWVHGELTFGLRDRDVTLDATAHVHARGLKDAELRITRDAQGHLRGSAALSVDLGDKFTGSATAAYEDGDVTIKGELGYQSEKFRGKLGLLVADAAQAEQLVRAQIGPAAVTPIAGGAKPGAAHAKPAGAKGERGIAGWGELDFAFTDWLVGKAMVVYGPTGHLTVQGQIAPPQRLDLMKTPKGIKRPILPELKIEASYGLPYIADIHVGIGVSLGATAELGPIYMTDLAVEGLYSTDPTVMNAFSVTGALRAQAHAGLELDVKGYAGLRILKHSVNVGAGIKGEAGVRAYAEARPTLGYRELAAPNAGKQGEYYLKGHLEMAAQPVLALGGRLFVELDSPWWSPAPDKTWEWPIGSLEYPLPTQLGVGADIDYVVGSDKWPELKLTEPSFDPSKFVDTMMDDRLPKKGSGAGEQSKAGTWQGVKPHNPTAPPPTVPKRPAKDAKPAKAAAPGGARGKAKKGKQTPEEQQSVPKTEDAAARWNAGMEALGALRKRSETDPETSAEIKQHLAELKARHGFTKLTARRSGDLWLVDAELNPKKTGIPVKAEDENAPAKAPAGSRLAALGTALAVEAGKAHPKRSALEARCREFAAQHGATVRISSGLKTGVSRVVFSEKTPPAGQQKERVEAEIAFVGRSDDDLRARAGADNTRELGVRERGGPGTDTALVNVGDRSMAENPNFEADAKAFEDKFAALAWRHPAANEGAAQMAAKAKAYLKLKVGAWDEANAELAALCQQIGADNPGWSGAVGTAIADVLACFDRGNIAERMNHVGAFHVQILGRDLLETEKKVLRQRLSSAGFAASSLMKRRLEMQRKKTKGDSNPWGIAPVAPTSQAAGQWHSRADRADVNGVPRALEGGQPNHEGRAAIARSERTLAETGATLSSREEALQRRGDPEWDLERDTIKWQEGVRVWIINERDTWVQWQRKLSLPLGAGPSGTTNQLMQAARDLRVEPYSARAACIAYLLPAHHHTLVEILAAANPFDCAYSPGRQMYRELRPFSRDELRACGKDGKFPDELADTKGDGDGAVTLRVVTKGVP
ncbi:MAG: DUF4157 domain-containing protein [Kofleriaceae bacterium]